MGESTDTTTNQQKKSKKHKLPTQPDEQDVEQPQTKLRKPQAPAKKSRKKLKQAERREKARAEIFDKYKSSVITYLESWKHNKAAWKFNKMSQNWIVRNMYNSKLIPDTVWPVVLEYFGSSMGVVKTTLITTATKIIEDSESSQEPDTIKLDRAKQIIQCINE